MERVEKKDKVKKRRKDRKRAEDGFKYRKRKMERNAVHRKVERENE